MESATPTLILWVKKKVQRSVWKYTFMSLEIVREEDGCYDKTRMNVRKNYGPENMCKLSGLGNHGYPHIALLLFQFLVLYFLNKNTLLTKHYALRKTKNILSFLHRFLKRKPLFHVLSSFLHIFEHAWFLTTSIILSILFSQLLFFTWYILAIFSHQYISTSLIFVIFI